MHQKIFTIMGATGQVGQIITEDLLKRGHSVRALGRDERKLHHLEIKGANPYAIAFDDADALADCFEDCFAAFCLIPPGYGEKSYSEYQDRVGEAIVSALQKADVKRVVNLSSIGANLAEGTGPIKALYRQEQRLNKLDQLLMLIHLRPSYFMENLSSYIPMIQSQKILSSCISGDLLIPMVATRDIGWKAADFLDKALPVHEIFDFAGPKEASLNYFAELLRKALDQPELHYIQISPEEEKKRMLSQGMSQEMVDLIVEMDLAFNAGLIKPTQELTREHRGITTLEEFVHMIEHRLFAHAR